MVFSEWRTMKFTFYENLKHNNIIPLFYVVNNNQICHINSVLCSSPKDVIVWENFLETNCGRSLYNQRKRPMGNLFYSIQVNSKGKPLQPLLGAEPKMEIPENKYLLCYISPRFIEKGISIISSSIVYTSTSNFKLLRNSLS